MSRTVLEEIHEGYLEIAQALLQWYAAHLPKPRSLGVTFELRQPRISFSIVNPASMLPR